jgi:glutamate/aspartate transport system substrate-binding protein
MRVSGLRLWSAGLIWSLWLRLLLGVRFCVLPSAVQSVLACLCFAGTPMPAQAADESLVKITQTGRIVLGVRDTTLPLSYLDASGAHIGYHMDVCRAIVVAIRRQYDLPQLKVVTVPTTLATRYAMLNNETIDIECGHNPVTSSALQQVLVSHATMVSELRIMTLSSLAGLSLQEVTLRPFGLIVGSASAPALRALTRNATLKPKEVFARQSADNFALLSAGRVDAIIMAQPYMLAHRALSGDPARYAVLDYVVKTEPLALLFRMSDEKLHALANEVLAGMMRSGEMQRLYDKWFTQAVPGLPAPIGIPASTATRALFADPGSEVLNM